MEEFWLKDVGVASNSKLQNQNSHLGNAWVSLKG